MTTRLKFLGENTRPTKIAPFIAAEGMRGADFSESFCGAPGVCSSLPRWSISLMVMSFL
jgi:hypothetical protein